MLHLVLTYIHTKNSSEIGTLRDTSQKLIRGGQCICI